MNDLYPFVITSYTSEPDPFSFPIANQVDDNGGGNSMAFYNMQKGDVPVLKSLADEYSMSDNYHQAVMGGTGANHVMMGTGDAIFWSDGKGNPTMPPSHIANPDPLPGSNNQYTVDIGFDGNFTECADSSQPGVDAVRDYLATLSYHPNPNCEPNHFYMVNNDNPGFLPDGTVDTAGIAKGGSVPPTNVRTIGESSNDKNISWAYYGGAYNAAVALQKLKEQATIHRSDQCMSARPTATFATSSPTQLHHGRHGAAHRAHQGRYRLLRRQSTTALCRQFLS